MTVIPFIPQHLDGLVVHEQMGYIQDKLTEEYGSYVSCYPAYTYVSNGEVIACAGVIPLSSSCYQAWGLLSEKSGNHMVGITRAIRDFIDLFKGDRIQSTVDAEFEIGQKWMDMLGFKLETPEPMCKYGELGQDCYLYSRVR